MSSPGRKKRVRFSNDFKDESDDFNDEMEDFVVSDEDAIDDPQLANILAKTLAEMLQLPTEQLIPVVKSAFRRLDLHDLGVSPEYQEHEIFQKIDQEQPQLEEILHSRLTESDMKKCLILWRQWKTLPENSKDWWQTSQEIREILSTRQHSTLERARFLEEEERRLASMTPAYTDLKIKILDLNAPDDIKAKLLSMYRTMQIYPEDSSFYSSLREEIEWSIRLPYQERAVDPHMGLNNTKLNQFYCKVQQELDNELYGMHEVKQKLLHILNDRRSSKDSCGRNLLLCGPPGTGKTQIGKVLAKILGKKFIKVSAASLDHSAIKGSNKVYVGSEPSIFLQSMASVKSNNPIVMIDEAEKMDQKAQQAMIHVSDPSDNMNFQDGYLKNNYHDLSNIFFIFNANSTEGMDEAFLDRLDVIEVPNYDLEEKAVIFMDYMLPKALETVGMSINSLFLDPNTVKKFIFEFCNMGLRSVEQKIKNLVGRVNMYRSVVLKNGKLGKLDLGYSIPNFSLPLDVNYELLCVLAN